jgi:hypothetical protein
VWARAFLRRSAFNTILDKDPKTPIAHPDGRQSCDGSFRWEMRDGRTPDAPWSLLEDGRTDDSAFGEDTTLYVGDDGRLVGGKVWGEIGGIVVSRIAILLEQAPRGVVPLQVRVVAVCKNNEPAAVVEQPIAEGTLEIDVSDQSFASYVGRIAAEFLEEQFAELFGPAAQPPAPAPLKTPNIEQLSLLGQMEAQSGFDTGKMRRKPWAWLLRHVFAIDVVVCPECSGKMRWRAVALTPETIAEGLARAGLSARGPPRGPRAPRGQLSLPFPR